MCTKSFLKSNLSCFNPDSIRIALAWLFLDWHVERCVLLNCFSEYDCNLYPQSSTLLGEWELPSLFSSLQQHQSSVHFLNTDQIGLLSNHPFLPWWISNYLCLKQTLRRVSEFSLLYAAHHKPTDKICRKF